MSRQDFSGAFDHEIEDGGSPSAMVAGVEAALRPLLEKEQERLQKEVDFLKQVHEGTGGAALEEVSTSATDSVLSADLNSLYE